MNRYYYDFHIHSCLSPCADDDMTPSNIAGMATLAGLNIVALTDHNTAKNCPAFFEAAKKYGDQCVVISADVKRVDGVFRVFAKGGRENTGMEAIEWIKRCVGNGAGEIVVNSIDTDGVKQGFDLEMLEAVSKIVSVPIIASGGAGKKEDFVELFRHKGMDAGLAASIFHTKQVDIKDLKRYLRENGVEMRL